MTRERWENMDTLQSREGKGRVCYPPEFWQARKDSSNRVAAFVARNGATLTRIAAWAVFMAIAFGWAWLLAAGGRF